MTEEFHLFHLASEGCWLKDCPYGGQPLSDAEAAEIKAAEIEKRFLGDLANWRPSGFLNTGPVPEIATTTEETQ